jgi:hypothetical protein
MPVERIALSIPSDLLIEVARRDRGNRSGAIQEIIEKYAVLMANIKPTLRPRFEANECALILDSLNGVWLRDDVNIRLLVANIEDAISMDQLDQKWMIDGPQLLAKLQQLSVAELYATADAVVIWWNRVGEGEQPAYEELFTFGAAAGYVLHP